MKFEDPDPPHCGYKNLIIEIIILDINSGALYLLQQSEENDYAISALLLKSCHKKQEIF